MLDSKKMLKESSQEGEEGGRDRQADRDRESSW